MGGLPADGRAWRRDRARPSCAGELQPRALEVGASVRRGGWLVQRRRASAPPRHLGCPDARGARDREGTRSWFAANTKSFSRKWPTALPRCSPRRSGRFPRPLHQTRIYPDVVQTMGGRVGYFLVDAMRFDMGVELARQLDGTKDLTIRPAVAALPTITTVGMAALLPGASASFSVIEHKEEALGSH